MTTTETGLKLSRILYRKPPAIIPRVKTAGDKAISNMLWRAMYASYVTKHDTNELQKIVDAFTKSHPKRTEAIKNTAIHFTILMELHYQFDTDEYEQSILTNLEHGLE